MPGATRAESYDNYESDQDADSWSQAGAHDYGWFSAIDIASQLATALTGLQSLTNAIAPPHDRTHTLDNRWQRAIAALEAYHRAVAPEAMRL